MSDSSVPKKVKLAADNAMTRSLQSNIVWLTRSCSRLPWVIIPHNSTISDDCASTKREQQFGDYEVSHGLYCVFSNLNLQPWSGKTVELDI